MGSSQEEPDTYNLPDMQLTVSKFISDIMATIKSQEDAKSYDFLTGLPMRNLGERLTAEFMQTHDGCLVFLDMDNLKKDQRHLWPQSRRPRTEMSWKAAPETGRSGNFLQTWRR